MENLSENKSMVAIAPNARRPSVNINPTIETIKKVQGKTKTSPDSSTGRWTEEEHQLFLQGLSKYGRSWKDIAKMIKTRTLVQIRTHAQKYLAKQNLGESSDIMAFKAARYRPIPLHDGFGGFGFSFANFMPSQMAIAQTLVPGAPYELTHNEFPIHDDNQKKLTGDDISPASIDDAKFLNFDTLDDDLDFALDDMDNFGWLAEYEEQDQYLELNKKERDSNTCIIRPASEMKEANSTSVKRRRIEPVPTLRKALRAVDFNPYMWASTGYMPLSNMSM